MDNVVYGIVEGRPMTSIEALEFQYGGSPSAALLRRKSREIGLIRAADYGRALRRAYGDLTQTPKPRYRPFMYRAGELERWADDGGYEGEQQ